MSYRASVIVFFCLPCLFNRLVVSCLFLTNPLKYNLINELFPCSLCFQMVESTPCFDK